MRTLLSEEKSRAVWCARALFNRAKTSGTTANISFIYDGIIWISRSGSCFGTMTEHDLVGVDAQSMEVIGEGKPSKELPLHQMLYSSSPDIRAVIHAHSPYAVLWSCLPHSNPEDVIPHYTPYLDMKLGAVAEVPYAAPGSAELFELFGHRISTARGYLLAHHGPIVGGRSLMNAFEALEELEQSAWLSWTAYSANVTIPEI